MQKEIFSKSPLGNFLLLIIVILVWGINWPLMKIAMNYIPPFWFGTIRLGIAALFFFLVLPICGQPIMPTRKDLRHISILGLTQIGLFTICINLGLFYNSVGHTVILVYSTPFWVAPLAVLYFGEKISRLKGVGLALGILGIIVLFNPLAFNWSNHLALIGSGFLLLAAILWAISIIFIRFSVWHSSIVKLLPWQLLIGTVLLFITALIFEPHTKIHWTASLSWLMLYMGTVATAFAYWGAIEISQRLSTVTSSLCLLGVPLVGVLSSTLYLHEPLTLNLIISLTLLIAGLAVISLAGIKN